MFKKRARDFQRCLKSIGSFTNGQAAVLDYDADLLKWIEIELAPNDGIYKGGKFTFKIKMGKDYPGNAPHVRCVTKIYHPNIDITSDEYNICLSLFDEWTEDFGLEDCIQGLLFLLYEPNLEDPLSPYFDGEMASSEGYEEFVKNVSVSLAGGMVEDEEYPNNWHLEEEDVPAVDWKLQHVNVEDNEEATNTEDDSDDASPKAEESKKEGAKDVVVILEEVEALVIKKGDVEEDDEDENNEENEDNEDDHVEENPEEDTVISQTVDDAVVAVVQDCVDAAETSSNTVEDVGNVDSCMEIEEDSAGAHAPSHNNETVCLNITRQSSKVDRISVNEYVESSQTSATGNIFDELMVTFVNTNMHTCTFISPDIELGQNAVTSLAWSCMKPIFSS